MYTPAFEELAGGDDFFSAHFGRAPLYRPAALTGDPRQILSIADLDDIVHSEAIRPPYIRVMKDGVMVPHVAFTELLRAQDADVTDTVVPQTVYELLRTGATITWPALNHLRPNVRALTRMLAAKFATEVNATAFLTPAGGRGINPQHAYFDVFVLQLEGTTAWTLWPQPPVRRDDLRNYRESELGEPTGEVALRPGDVLYLPWGTPNVVAGGAGVSLHLSVMMRVRLWSHLLLLTVERLVADEPFWQAPYLNDATASRQAGLLAARAALLAGRLREIDLDGELRRLITLGQPSLGSAQGGFRAMVGTRSGAA
ncbi:MAG TPA: cupin domain-containing protein [Streptosporangiaceae bacterium]|nr:cupin domain-containing protein [Streptosporangiaceae bacterium]